MKAPGRHYGHWIYDGLLPFTAGSNESSERIILFSALAGIGALLEARCYLISLGKKLYANNYIWIVGPSGRAKKTTGANIITDMMSQLEDFNMNPSKITLAAMIRDMHNRTKPIFEHGREYRQSPYFIYAPELTDFLTRDVVTTDGPSFLTSIWDCPSIYRKMTKTGTREKISRPVVSMLGCTTPEWLANAIPPEEARSGLGSRIIFVPEFNEPDTFIAWGRTDDDMDNQERQRLIADLNAIYSLHGEFRVDEDARNYYERWYHYFRGHQVQTDNEKRGFIERKSMHVLKLAMVNSVCRDDSLHIGLVDIKQAISWLDSIEDDQHLIFRSGGANKLYPVGEKVLDLIVRSGGMTRMDLLRHCNKDVGAKELGQVLLDLDVRGDIVFSPNEKLGKDMIRPSRTALKDAKASRNTRRDYETSANESVRDPAVDRALGIGAKVEFDTDLAWETFGSSIVESLASGLRKPMIPKSFARGARPESQSPASPSERPSPPESSRES